MNKQTDNQSNKHRKQANTNKQSTNTSARDLFRVFILAEPFLLQAQTLSRNRRELNVSQRVVISQSNSRRFSDNQSKPVKLEATPRGEFPRKFEFYYFLQSLFWMCGLGVCVCVCVCVVFVQSCSGWPLAGISRVLLVLLLLLLTFAFVYFCFSLFVFVSTFAFVVLAVQSCSIVQRWAARIVM